MNAKKVAVGFWVVLTAALVCANWAWGADYYVSPNGDDANDGLSLATAKRTIQAGVDIAAPGDTVRVNDGTYVLGAKIIINKAVTVRAINGRDVTIVDGNKSVRCFDVAHAAAALDGFTIQQGNDAAISGVGGVNNAGTLRNCLIRGNTAPWGYGGMVNAGVVEDCLVFTNVSLFIGGVGNNAAGVLRNCVVASNYSGVVAGVLNDGVVTNCVVRNNTSLSSAGGIMNNPGGLVYASTIQNNAATNDAGGVYNTGGILDNCVIAGNTASEGAGLVNTNAGMVRNCAISGNTAATMGGGALNADGIMEYCVISGNQLADEGMGGGVFNAESGVLRHCNVVSNRMGLAWPSMTYGGGICNEAGVVSNCYVAGNVALMGGGVMNAAGLVRGCVIEYNEAGYGGGGLYNYDPGSRAWDCMVRYNKSLSFEGAAGGIYNDEGSELRNCLVIGNLALGAGGAVNYGTMYNCVVAGNEALAQVGGVVNFGGILNAIIAGNTAPAYADYYDDDGGGLIGYSCLLAATPGEGNIAANPGVINPGSGYGLNHVYGDYRLAMGSPCINAGRNEGWMLAPGATDLDGNPRIIYAKVDMGVYEYFAPPTVVAATDGQHTDRITITWNAADPAPAYYEVWRAQVNDHNQAAMLAAAQGLSCNDASAVPGALYYYWVRPVLVGRGPFSASDSGWRAMTPPTGLTASDGLYTDGVCLSWNASYGAISYKMYRGVGADFSAALEVGRPAGSPWMDTNAVPGVHYHYWVCAVGAITQSGTSDPDIGWRRSHAATQNAWSDFDGDGLLDLAVFNPQTGLWRIWLSHNNYAEVSLQLGGAGCLPVTGDFNGDGLTDPAVYREATGEWTVFMHDGQFWRIESRYYGGAGWQPVPGDYDGDGRADFGVYNRVGGQWRGLLSGAGYTEAGTQFGGAGWQAAPADYDGDGKTDPAVYNTGNGDWAGMFSGNGYRAVGTRYGGPGWMPVPADYDGDFKADPAVYNPQTGDWSGLMSAAGYQPLGTRYGGPGWWPLPADYDGDGKADVVVYNQTTGAWRGLLSAAGYAETGTVFGGPDWAPLR